MRREPNKNHTSVHLRRRKHANDTTHGVSWAPRLWTEVKDWSFLGVGDEFVALDGAFAGRAIARIQAVNDVATSHMLGAKGAKFHVALLVFASSRQLPTAAKSMLHGSLDICAVRSVTPC